MFPPYSFYDGLNEKHRRFCKNILKHKRGQQIYLYLCMQIQYFYNNRYDCIQQINLYPAQS